MGVDVLIAEDEPSILDSLDFILRRAGFSIESVTDGDAALAAIRRQRPRLVVLDARQHFVEQACRQRRQ